MIPQPIPAPTAAFATCGMPVPTGSTRMAVGPLDGVLNDLDELLGLVDGVVVGVDDLNLDPESRGHFGYGDCLFGLVIVLSGGESNNYIQFVHGVLAGTRRGRLGVVDCFTRRLNRFT